MYLPTIKTIMTKGSKVSTYKEDDNYKTNLERASTQGFIHLLAVWSCFIDKDFVKEPKLDYFYSLSVLLSTCYLNVKFDVMKDFVDKICMITSTHTLTYSRLTSSWAGFLNTISAQGLEFYNDNNTKLI